MAKHHQSALRFFVKVDDRLGGYTHGAASTSNLNLQ